MNEIKPRAVYQLVRTDKPDDGTDIYIGSTSQPLKQRLSAHRYHAKVCKTKLHTRMFEVGIYNWKILPLLVYICDQKTIREFEKVWVELFNPDLNVNLPFKENNEKTIERVKEHQRKILESKRYYCNICDKFFKDIVILKTHLKTLKHSYAYMNSVD